ncbi:hypothetical protein [Haladaptatus sp. DFWS20]|uniref:hypothetical protein n=1 Tax=Haladaptatus sp. DFWS20 TaxID=3403467 RepID=UPI003EBFA8D0
MKSGASDPFADDTSDDAVEQSENDETESAESEAEEEQVNETGRARQSGQADRTNQGSQIGQSDEAVTPGSNTHQISREDLPLTLRRDNVKDERENVHQLFVQTGTDERAKDAERELESLVGEDVYRLDAREAIYLAGMQNLTEAAEILRNWGYDL